MSKYSRFNPFCNYRNCIASIIFCSLLFILLWFHFEISELSAACQTPKFSKRLPISFASRMRRGRSTWWDFPSTYCQKLFNSALQAQSLQYPTAPPDNGRPLTGLDLIKIPHQRLLFLFCVYSFVHIGAQLVTIMNERRRGRDTGSAVSAGSAASWAWPDGQSSSTSLHSNKPGDCITTRWK